MAFCLPIAGQAVVTLVDVPFLPPGEEWDSGLLPYPLLLAATVLFIGLLSRVALDLLWVRLAFLTVVALVLSSCVSPACVLEAHLPWFRAR